MSDPSAFYKGDIETVWGSIPLCPLTNQHSVVDLHHILGRGDKQQRGMFSSVFNCSPLLRPIHAGPIRDHPLFRLLLLQITRRRIMNAVNLGTYTMNDHDTAFLAYADEWIKENALNFTRPENP